MRSVERAERPENSRRTGLRSACSSAGQTGQLRDLRPAHPAQQIVQPGQGIRGPSCQQEVQRLGQATDHHRDHDSGGHGSEQECGSPAVARDEEGPDRAPHGGADRVTRDLQADGRAAPAAGGVLGGDDVEAGQDAADADAREHTERRELGGPLRERGAEHAEGDHAQTQQGDRPAPEPIRPRGDEQGAARHADESRAQQPAQSGPGQAPLPGDLGGRERHHQHVEPVEHVEGDAKGYGEHLEAAHRALVDDLPDVEALFARFGGKGGHDGPLL